MGQGDNRSARSRNRTKTHTETTTIVIRRSKRSRSPSLGDQWQRTKNRLAATAGEVKEEEKNDAQKEFPGLEKLLNHVPNKD